MLFRIVIAFLLIGFLSALCAQSKVSQTVRFEIAPHTGFMDGSGQFGLDLSMNYPAVNLEFSAAQVIGETANLYPLNVNVVFNFAQKGKLIPFGSLGAGLLLNVPTTALGSKTLSLPGLNFGGGLRFYLSEEFGVRLGVNQYLLNVESNRDNVKELLIFQEVTLGFILILN